MNFALYILVAAGSYLLGCVSLSILLSKKLYGSDVRGMGSGNAGATNMARVFGLNAGLLTLMADTLKAAIAMFIGNLLLGDMGVAVAGIANLLGHCYPVFYGFKGGKGVSVGLAVAYAIDWKVGITLCLVFAVVAFFTKKVSPASVSAAAAIIAAALIFQVSTPKLVLAVFGAVLVIYRHKENIKRLIAGTEPNFKPGSRKDKY